MKTNTVFAAHPSDSPPSDAHSLQPLRVLMTADTLGGTWNYSLTLTAGLAEYGVEVGLATMGPRPNIEQKKQAASIPNLKLFESNYRLEWMSNSEKDVRAAGQWLLQLEQNFDPGIIHLNHYAYGSLPWRRPVVVVAHSRGYSWFDAAPGTSLGMDPYRRTVRAGLQAADEIVAPTATLLADLRRHYSVERGRVIPNDCKHHRNIQIAKQPLIFSWGRLRNEARNVQLLEAAQGLDWPVCVAGDLGCPSNDPVGASSNAHLLGILAHEEILSWMSRAAIFVSPPRHEPFGLSALEAAQAGCALVLGDIPPLREIWGSAALYVDANDPQALTCALRRLIDEPAIRMDYASRARERASHYWSEKMTKDYLHLYCDCLLHRSIVSGSASEVVNEIGPSTVVGLRCARFAIQVKHLPEGKL